MLRDKITIREIFSCKEDAIYLVHLSAGMCMIEKRKISDISDQILPTAGYYMDADAGEFDEEIAMLELYENNYIGNVRGDGSFDNNGLLIVKGAETLQPQIERMTGIKRRVILS